MDGDTFGEDLCDNSGMQRVKLYRLTADGLWEEKGTGSVSVEYMEQSGAVGLVVIAENDSRTLLIHRISFDDIYQRQGEDTIITWMDAELETDIALSFQEENGCNVIWDQLQEVQKRGQESASHVEAPDAVDAVPDAATTRDDSLEAMIGPQLDPDYGEGKNLAVGSVELPAAELRNLQRIAAVLQSVSPFQRDRLAEQAMASGYLRRLLDLFHDLEDLEDTDGLHSMYMAVRGLIMLNDTILLENMVNEENVMDVVGALEYDPGHPVRQQHRMFLRDKVVFREVVPITNPSVRAKIHQTYRVGYLKDVILPRVLDDGTFATLSSLMMFNNVEVLVALTQSATFFPDLFRKLSSSSNSKAANCSANSDWEDHVSFLQELCGMAKHLQVSNRTQMLDKLIGLGLFRVMTTALERPSDSLRLRAMDVLLAAAQHDPAPLRSFIEAHPEQGRLLDILIQALADVSQGGLQEQALEVLRVLLNPEASDGPAEKNSFLEIFYQQHMCRILDILTAGGGANVEAGGAPAATLVVLMELLCFCVSRHAMRIKFFVLRNQCLEAVLKLLHRREAWLAVAAVRFLRTCVGLKDEFYHRYIVRNNLFEPVVASFLANGSRYNLFNSAVLELVEFIRAENIKSLLAHLADKFGERLAGIDYVDTFAALRLKYEQSQDRSGGHATGSVTAAAQEALTQQRWRPDVRAPSKHEEDYFGEGGDEEDDGGMGSCEPDDNKQSPSSLPRLVDYADDDDEDIGRGGRRSPTLASDFTSMHTSGSFKRGAQLRDLADSSHTPKRLRGPDHGRRRQLSPPHGGRLVWGSPSHGAARGHTPFGSSGKEQSPDHDALSSQPLREPIEPGDHGSKQGHPVSTATDRWASQNGAPERSSSPPLLAEVTRSTHRPDRMHHQRNPTADRHKNDGDGFGGSQHCDAAAASTSPTTNTTPHDPPARWHHDLQDVSRGGHDNSLDGGQRNHVLESWVPCHSVWPPAQHGDSDSSSVRRDSNQHKQHELTSATQVTHAAPVSTQSAQSEQPKPLVATGTIRAGSEVPHLQFQLPSQTRNKSFRRQHTGRAQSILSKARDPPRVSNGPA